MVNLTYPPHPPSKIQFFLQQLENPVVLTPAFHSSFLRYFYPDIFVTYTEEEEEVELHIRVVGLREFFFLQSVD